MSLVTTAPSYVTGQIVTAAQLNALQDGIQAAWTPFTPTVTAGAGTFTSVAAALRYLQVGKRLDWSCALTITTVGTATGAVNFTLPVTPKAAAAGSVVYIGGGRAGSTTGKMLEVSYSPSVASVTYYDATSAIAAGAIFAMLGTYEVA